MRMRIFFALVVGLLFSLVIATPVWAGQAEVGKGAEARATAPLHYVASSPNDAGASRILYRKVDLPELPPNVPITSIEFDKRKSFGDLPVGSFTIHIKNSNEAALAASPLSAALAGATQVYTNTALTLPAAEGWIKLDFATPFTYTGNGLEVITVWNSSSGPRAEDVHWGEHTTGTVCTRLVSSAAEPLADGASLDAVTPFTRPNVRFDYTSPSNTPWLVVEYLGRPIMNGGTVFIESSFTSGVAVDLPYHLYNKGNATMALAPIDITDKVGVTAIVGGSHGGSILPGTTVPFSLRHSASVTSGTVGYTVSFSGFSFRVQGTAKSAPASELDLELRDFPAYRFTPATNNGTIFLGAERIRSTRTVMLGLTNFGTSPLTFGATPVEVVSASPGTTTVTVQPSTLNPQVPTNVELKIQATATGDFSTTVRVATNDADEGTFTLTIRLSIFDPLSPPTVKSPDIDLAFAATGTDGTPIPTGGAHTEAPISLPGGKRGLRYVVKNVGKGLLDVSSATASNPVNCSPVVAFTPTQLAEGASAEVLVEVAPTTAGPASFTLSVASSDPDEPLYTITANLSGAGTDGPDASADGGGDGTTDPGPSDPDDGGCSVSMPGTRASGLSFALSFLALVVAARRRRARRT